MEQEKEALQHIFQQEFSRMVAVISKLFGLQHIEMAEDIVSETFMQAAETWGIKGLPENPAAWLYVVAKQKTLHHFRRNKIYQNKVVPEIMEKEGASEPFAIDFSTENIRDSKLQMLFAICTPAIASEAQMGLALRILCGFGIDEIAEAFLSNKEAINKRLFRAKEKLRAQQIRMEFPPEDEIVPRLNNVLHIIYLLFNEGYYSKTQNQIVRKELCWEAMSLGVMLTEYKRTNRPETNALMALMCFHASRFGARQAGKDSLVLYEYQDEALWDQRLISQGMYFLDLSARGGTLSSYHLEARIAYWHCVKEDTKEKWDDILGLYDQLLLINYSPSVALNRVFALYKVYGQEKALAEADKIKMEHNHFYFVLLGELHKNTDTGKAWHNFEKAYTLAGTETERNEIKEKIKALPVSHR